MESFTKQKYEKFRIVGDFKNQLESGEILVSESCTVIGKNKRNRDVSTEILDPSTIQVNGSQLSIIVTNGDPLASPYIISFRGQINIDHKWEIDVKMLIEKT